MSRRMRLFIALLFATLAFYTLTIPLSPVHSQGETPTQTYLIAAGDALALTEALAGANHAAEFGDVATVIYLEGGTYTFALPGSPSQPILPTVRGNLTLYGNNATLLFRYLETPLYPGITPIIIMPQGDLTIHHATLRVMEGNGRAITNYGALHILDAVIDTGDPTAAEGGIINEGELLISRTTFAHHRQRSAAAVGGAIYNVGQMSITCGRFLNNRASQGGAIYNAEGGTAAIHESYFEGNYGNGGGAVFNGAESPLDASGNWWGADGVPEVNETTFVADAVSTSVTFMPAAVSDPTQTSGCASPPPQTPPIPAT
ncbi:MAG TPA: hypothetical protein PLD47_13745, partial [Aggregatilineales bacterium]|nr:hypothetical protein [Aggregatilineales bacterium]